MKKSIIVGTLVFFGFCTSGFSDMLDDLKSFEKSLSEWVEQIDELNKKLSALENAHETKSKQQDSLISEIYDRMEQVEKQSSEAGVGKVLKTFEKTMDIFKKRLSDMTKRLEDQEVKTAVLERIYQTAAKPVETLTKTIDEQNKVIDNLSRTVSKQEKTLLAMKKRFDKQTMPSGSFNESIEKLNDRIADLELGTVVVRETEKRIEEKPDAKIEKIVKAGKEDKKTAVATQETTAGTSEAVKEKVETTAKKVPGTEGFEDIGKGFFVKNIEFKPFGSSSNIKGEILNKSGRYHGFANFRVQVYDEGNVVLGDHRFSINAFKMDSTKAFDEVMVGVSPKKISMYAIFFAEMQSFTAEGEDVIKIFRKDPEIVKAETKEDTSGIENMLPFDKIKEKTLKELEGFESVGNEFYAGTVSFDDFGSSSSASGKIKNNSKKDFYKASFIMKIYNNFGMITSFSFSVRGIKSGETKPFEEIVTGVRPVDIKRYEIVFKDGY